MPNMYLDVDVKCPFYLRHDPQKCSVSCEGLASSSTVCKNFFQNGKTLSSQIRTVCAGDYEACPVYKALAGKYADT